MSVAKGKSLKYLYRKTVKGIAYIYFRMPVDGKLIPLPKNEGSAEFRRSYAACLKTVTGVAKPGPRPVVENPPRVNASVAFIGGTVGKAIETYLDSSSFRENIKVSSQHKYRRVLDEMRDLIGATLLADLDLDAVNIYSEGLSKNNGPSVADFHVSLLSNIWQECRKYPQFGIRNIPNPTRDAERRYKVKHAHQPWTDEAQEKFMATAPETLKLAKLLLHFSAQRGGDCVKMKWSDFDGRGITVVPEKGGEMELGNYHRCPKPLLDALNRAHKRRGDAETILVNSWGKPWKNANTLGKAIRVQLVRCGLAKPGVKTFVMHGLRKNAASEVGSLLLGTAGIKSVTGHKSNEMAEYYAKHAEQRAINAKTVAAWDEALEQKAAARVRARRAKLRSVK
jgi:integrase